MARSWFSKKVMQITGLDANNTAVTFAPNFMYDYNNHRPHDAPGGIPPIVFRNLNIFAEEKTKHELKAVVI